MVVGLLLNAIGMGWLSAVARSDSSYAGIILPLIVGGCGISMAMPAAQKSVVGAVKLQEIGQASGAITTLRIFGGVFGIAILTAVFTGSGGGFATSKAFTDGFGPAMFAAAIVAFIGAVFGLGMPGRSRAASPVIAPPQSVPADQAASAR